MRRVICILFLLTTFYLAGVYQLESLMIFFMAQIGLLLILWLYTWYIASRVEVSLALENDTVEKGETARGSAAGEKPFLASFAAFSGADFLWKLPAAGEFRPIFGRETYQAGKRKRQVSM